MRTTLTILAVAPLAAVVLTFGAPVTLISGTAVAGGNIGPQYWCGAPICPTKHPPGIYRRR
jgi:hypothetical protein